MSEENVELFEENVPEINVESEVAQIVDVPQETVVVEEEVQINVEVEVTPVQEIVIIDEPVKVNKKVGPRKWL